MGVVDPTAAVLAGMFIDRMRSAQVMEAGQQPSVAQQVLGGGQPQMPPMGAPPAPPQGMAPPPQGMGAPPQQMPMAPPPQDMGMAPPQGMASGGLTTLPVPDAMFDEPEDGGYAGGGMVAFASGGPLTGEEAWGRIKRIEGGLGPKGEMRVSSAGAVGPSQLMPATAPEAAKLAGLPWDEKRYRTDPEYNEALGKAYYLSRVAARKGDYNKAALDYHSGMGNVDKGKIGPAGRDYARKFAGTELPERDFSTAEGRASSVTDEFQNLVRQFGPTAKEREVDDKRMARAEEIASDEYQEKERRYDDGMLMAEIGFGWAASNSPYALQAFGQAVNAALPGSRASRKERKALKDRALDVMGQLNDKTRRENLQLLGIAVDMKKEGMKQVQFERELGSRETQARLDRITQKELAALKPSNPSDLEIMMAIMQNGTPEQKTALKDVMDMKKQQSGMALPGMEGAGNTGVDLSKWGQATVVPQ